MTCWKTTLESRSAIKIYSLTRFSIKVLILSDLHFGHAASSAGLWLDGISTLARNYDRVILNGDTLDRYERLGCQPNSEQLISDVVSACRSRSGPPEIIAGNHDPAISTLHWVYLAQSATLIFHGDCITDCTHPSKSTEQRLASAMRERWRKIGGRPQKFQELLPVFREAQGHHLRENPRMLESRTASRYLLRTVFPPHRPLHVLYYWWKAPGRVAQLAATFDQPVRHVVVGHSHLPGRWRRHGLTIFNTGGCMPLTTPFAVCAEGSRVTFQRLTHLLRSSRVIFAPIVTNDKRA
ncbi:MAG: metallophosphoesterase [Planctomycetota bacterium]